MAVCVLLLAGQLHLIDGATVIKCDPDIVLGIVRGIKHASLNAGDHHIALLVFGVVGHASILATSVVARNRAA